MDSLTSGFLSSGKVDDLFSARATLGAMLEVEAALAHTLAATGIVPAKAAAAIGHSCDAANFDMEAIRRATKTHGNPCIEVVTQLTEVVRAASPPAAQWVHWGATSQDIIDTATVLQLKRAVTHIAATLTTVIEQLHALVVVHRETIMVARTLLQHALPTTFGFKAAGWLNSLLDQQPTLQLPWVCQFGGAAGTLASFGEKGIEVRTALAAELGLDSPTVAWHTDRQSIASTGAAIALIAATFDKIAQDVILCMQTEVAELRESSGGSSAMPHKRNPVAAVAVRAAAARTPGLVATLLSAAAQEHERAAGYWHAEWPTLGALCTAAAAAAENSVVMFDTLEVDAQRMRSNLDLTNGLIMAEAIVMRLSDTLGRETARRIVTTACEAAAAHGESLKSVLAREPSLDDAARAQLDDWFEPASYLGSSGAMIDAVLDKLQKSR